MAQKLCYWLMGFFLLFLWQGTVAMGGEKQIKVESTAFEEGGMIPERYTCDGADVSPPLALSAVPEGTKSIALICDDPDAPRGTWVHWVLFNLPPETRAILAKGMPAELTEKMVPVVWKPQWESMTPFLLV